jgi:probable HAF family extracellular repeat protein
VRITRVIVGLAVGACALVAGGTAANAAVPSASADQARPWRIVDLGLGDDSHADAINERGHVVGGSAAGGFLWRRGAVTYLGHLPGHTGSWATDVNNRDEVVGNSYAADGTSHAFLWRRGVMTDLGVLPGGDNSYAKAINDRGDVVGFSASAADNGELRAVRWHHGTMTVLETPAHHSVANDIHNRGDIVGNATAGQSVESPAVRWRHDRIHILAAGLPTDATAVNQRGDITGLVFGGRTHGFLWQRGRLVQIDPPPGSDAIQPWGINDRTQIVGSTDYFAFVWQSGRTIALPRLKGASVANDINDRGQIVGSSTVNPDGTNAHAVLWTR